MNESRRQYVSGRARRKSERGFRMRWIVIALVIAIAFAVGVALGVALERGPNGKGVQTHERTIRIVTVTVKSS